MGSCTGKFEANDGTVVGIAVGLVVDVIIGLVMDGRVAVTVATAVSCLEGITMLDINRGFLINLTLYCLLPV